MKRLLIAFFALLLFPAVASAAPAPTTPDPAANPVLASIEKLGAKFYYLGNHAGLDGWFIVKGAQIQIAYATADNKNALIGAMFGENGENVTAMQVAALVQNNKDVADLITSAQKEQAALLTGSPTKTSNSIPTSGALPSSSLSPGERLLHDLSSASTVVVGNPSSPELLMVMDPRCPHCQATWNALRNDVIKGALHIRMIPIGTADTDNERAAAMLLSAPDPMTAWDKYVAGDATPLAGTPAPAALASVRSNHTMIDGWHIEDTPYLVYRAKDGKIKVVQGEPDKLSVLLNDMGI